jgi:hypothetical protein
LGRYITRPYLKSQTGCRALALGQEERETCW